MIAMENVSITLGDFSLKNVNLNINKGEFFTIIGPTGTGKTVLLEIIAGFHTPESGNVYLNGNNVENIFPEKRSIGFVYQDYALFPHLNVFKNIAFGLSLKKTPANEITDTIGQISELLGVNHLLGRYPGTLSGGEQQRVALARALVVNPKVMLLDEPFSSLDPNTKKILYNELKLIHKKYRCTIVHVTHDFDEAKLLGERIAVILDGSVKKIGSPSEIFEGVHDEKTAKFLGNKTDLKFETQFCGSMAAPMLE